MLITLRTALLAEDLQKYQHLADSPHPWPSSVDDHIDSGSLTCALEPSLRRNPRRGTEVNLEALEIGQLAELGFDMGFSGHDPWLCAEQV